MGRHYQAYRILERIKAIFNKAIAWGWNRSNPATGISKFKEKPRDRFARPDELPRLFKSIDEEENVIARDYLWISILTGARKSDVRSMQWADINWEQRQWRIPNPKNEEPYIVPLVDRALAILSKQHREATSEWVFPSNTSSTGHLTDPKKAWRRVLKRAEIENLRIHDIRQTLGSYQAITGVSLAIIGKSLGHKSQTATEIYARLDLDPVRASMEKATMVMFSETSEAEDA